MSLANDYKGISDRVTVIAATAGNKTDKIRVAAYCRVSTDKTDQVNSFLTQMRYYTDYIKSNPKMILIDIYADEGISGTLMDKRDEFKRLLKDCKNRKIDRVLVKSVTRFARNSLECIEAVRELKSYGVSVFFENDKIDTENMNSEMLLYIKSAFAQNESMSLSKRMVQSIRMRMEEGTYKLGIAPYGYKLVDGELVVKPDEARNIRKIFDLYLSGIGANAIVKYMQAHETGDMLWNIGRINYVLENERYTGNMIMGKTYTPNVLPLRNRPNKGQMDSFYYSDTHEGIITKEEFDKVKEIKKMRQKTFCRGAKEKEFFSGKIKCRHCGWAYRPIVRNDKMLWSCSKKGLSIDVCHTPNRSNEQIERAFVSMYNKVRQNEKSLIDETIAQLQMLKIRINRGNDEIMQIDKDISVLSAQESLFTTLYSEGSFNEDLYFEKTDTIKKKISELKTRRAHLVSEDDDERCIERLRELKRNLQQFPVGITEFDKDIFNGIIKQIYIEESGAITFVLKGDLEFSAEV